MNLKEAARTIGVHYQTAYKWVRSGDLAAVRIGSRYEVSPAAIDQFLANRRTLVEQAEFVSDEHRRITDVPPEDFLEELEAMATDPIVTIPAVEGFVARRAVHVLGDTCLVAIDSPDRSFRHALIDHPRADRAAFYNAVIGISGATLMEERGFLGGRMARGESVLMPIVDQVALRRNLKSELRQYLDVFPIHSLVGAPVMVGDEVRGVLAFTRDAPGHPYTDDDERLVRRIAARVGPLVRTADEIAEAWRLRRALADLACCLAAKRVPGRPLTGDELRELLFAPGTPGGEADLPCVAFAPDETVLAVNRAFEQTFTYPSGDVVGVGRPDVVPGELQEREAAHYERLRSGEIDFDDLQTQRLGGGGRVFDIAIHRVAVREPDATLACVITVARLIHHVVDGDAGAPTANH